MTNGDVLNSWKEIATYVGRGVRTVQRWEQELKLPIRRPRGKSRSAVIALKEDIDVWLRTPHPEKGVHRIQVGNINPEMHTRLLENTKTLLARTTAVLENSNRVRTEVRRSLAIVTLRRHTQAMRVGVRRAIDSAKLIRGGGRFRLKTSQPGASEGLAKG